MQTFEIKPEVVPHTDQRTLVITEADLNRLRRLVADAINAYENAAKMYKETAQAYKRDGMKDEAHLAYKEADWSKGKVKKLAKISTVLKYNALNDKECVQNFNNVGVSLVDSKQLTLKIQQANAWWSVAEVIGQRVTEWYSYGDTGREAVLNILKRYLPKKPQV